jgi:hypothetical protein
MTLSVAGVSAPTELSGLSGLPVSGVIAAQRHPTEGFRAILRRDRDVLHLCVVIGADGSRGAPGWIAFDRWWDELTAGGTNACLGTARVYRAYVPGQDCAGSALAGLVHGALPAVTGVPGWYDHGPTTEHGLATWEFGPRPDAGADRRIVVVAREGDPYLAAWTGSADADAMSPLAGYLLHAAKVRRQLRVWEDDRWSGLAHRRATDLMMRVQEALAHADTPEQLPSATSHLRAARDEVRSLCDLLLAARRSIAAARADMGTALGRGPTGPLGAGLFADDDALVGWFVRQLDDAVASLVVAQTAADKLGEPSQGESPPPDVPPPPPVSEVSVPDEPSVATRPTLPPVSPAKIAMRVGFTVDVVGYSQRPDDAKIQTQERIARLVGEVLRDLSVDPSAIDSQATGDGMNVFLPESCEVHRVVPSLLRATQTWLTHTNSVYRDRLRLRMAIAFGPVGVAALGFSGDMVIECARLVDSEPLREALTNSPVADLAVLISDPLRRQLTHPAMRDFSLTRWTWRSRVSPAPPGCGCQRRRPPDRSAT